MQPNTPIISAEFDVLAFEKNELKALKEDLQELGPTRIRKAYKVRGGVETTLWMVATWIGLNYASGIVSHISSKHYDHIMLAIHKFYKRYTTSRKTYAQAISLCLSYDDLDIEINLPGETRVDFLNYFCQQVLDNLQTEPLRSSGVTKIYIPYIYDSEERFWLQTYVWSESDFCSRYWGISQHGDLNNLKIYDSDERQFIDVSYDEIL